MSSLFNMEPDEFGNIILELTIDIFLNRIESVNCFLEIFLFTPAEITIFKKFLDQYKLNQMYFNKNKQMKLNDKDSDNFETKNFYIGILYDINKMINTFKTSTKFNSYFSILYFFRIIHFLKLLIKAKKNVASNDKVKIFLFMIFLLIKGDENFIKKLGLNEAFYLGTFEELKKEYPKQIYEDSESIKNLINNWKNESQAKSIVNQTFQKITELLQIYGSTKDKIIKDMLQDSQNILYDTEKCFNAKLLLQLKKFYNNSNYVLILNYFSEMDYNGDSIIDGLNMEFFNDKPIYSDINFNINSKSEIDSVEYEEFQKIIRLRMTFSFPKEILNYGFESEYIICSTLRERDPIECYKTLINIKEALENINDTEIRSYIEEIFKENDIYEIFFSIMCSEVIKDFFCGIVYIDNEEFKQVSSRIKDSESFKDIYISFLNKYNKKDNNYKDFKNLIILKTLSKGDRACIIIKLKKYIINPSQFFIGEKIIQDKLVIKDILKGYLIIILLHETEHFFRIFNQEEKDVFSITPRELEGGRLFIKYLFGVESISHINQEQVNKLLKIDNWENHEKLKTIFKGQKEEVITQFTTKIHDKSISFYSTNKKYLKGNKKGNFVPLKK